jgi:hypothetical protein
MNQLLEFAANTVFEKSLKGSNEIKSRAHGLTPKMRQALILIDGHRNVETLSRFVPSAELNIFLTELESHEFIRRTNSIEPSPAANLPQNLAQTLAQNFPPPTPAARSLPELSDRLPAANATGSVPTKSASAQSPTTDVTEMRKRLSHLLLETAGPSADQLGMRIERATSIEELRELVPAMISVVEALRGKRIADQFSVKLGVF